MEDQVAASAPGARSVKFVDGACILLSSHTRVTRRYGACYSRGGSVREGSTVFLNRTQQNSSK